MGLKLVHFLINYTHQEGDLMENVVYERDYTTRYQSNPKSSMPTFKTAIYEAAKESELFSEFKNKIQFYPRMVVPKNKANYEYLLPRLDALARNLGGVIHAEINYQRWESFIELDLPFLDFSRHTGYDLLTDIAKKTDSLSITATEDGGIRVLAHIDYFIEIGIDNAGMQKILDEELRKYPDLEASVKEYRNQSLKQDLELITGIPSSFMNEDMIWFVGYCNKLTYEEIDHLLNSYFAGCTGNTELLIKRIRQFRTDMEH